MKRTIKCAFCETKLPFVAKMVGATIDCPKCGAMAICGESYIGNLVVVILFIGHPSALSWTWHKPLDRIL